MVCVLSFQAVVLNIGLLAVFRIHILVGFLLFAHAMKHRVSSLGFKMAVSPVLL